MTFMIVYTLLAAVAVSLLSLVKETFSSAAVTEITVPSPTRKVEYLLGEACERGVPLRDA